MNLLNHKILGKGKPLVILHGLFGSLDNWITLGKKFSEQNQVVLVDQRNHGLSFHDDEFGYEIMSRDVIRLLDHLSIDSANFIGHSMGGKTAMVLANKCPEKVNKLIIADIGPKQYPVHHQSIIEAFYAVPINDIKSRKDAEESLEPLVPNYGVRQFLLKNLSRTPDGFKWKMNLDVISNNIEQVGKSNWPVNTYDGETLFIRGGNSDYILDKDIPSIQSKYPSSKFATIDNAGHWLHAENPVSFFENVIEYLNE